MKFQAAICSAITLYTFTGSCYSIPDLTSLKEHIQSVLSMPSLRASSSQLSDNHYSKIDKQEWPVDLTMYENKVVIRISPPFDSARVHSYCRKIPCNIWSAGSQFVDVAIDSDQIDNMAYQLGINYTVIIPNLAQKVFESYPDKATLGQRQLPNSNISDLFFTQYQPLKSIYSWVDTLAENYPQLVSVTDFGTTYEGQKLKALTIDTSQYSEENPNNKTIVIAAGIHAREWISISSATYIIHKLLTNYGISKPETDYLNKLNIVIIPVFNPDGYTYTWTSDRLWRKNRQETYHPRCFGIDLDHSFDSHWEKTADTYWPCDEDYSGEAPMEALEVSHFSYFLNKTLAKHDHLKVHGFLDLHSYSQEILYPYSYSCDSEPRDKENLMELAYGLSKAIRINSGKNYQVLSACEDKNVDLSPGSGSGSSLDYMYSRIMAHWAFQVKLRDSGSHGFLLPSKYIKPVGDEIYGAVKYFFDFILDPDL